MPPRTVAVGLFIRLSAPSAGISTADLDDLRVIEWDPAGTAMSDAWRLRVSISGSMHAHRGLLVGTFENLVLTRREQFPIERTLLDNEIMLLV